MASGVVPQVTGVFGTCGGGLAMIPALTDFTFMEEKNAKLFVNSPNALDENEISKCDTSAASFQSAEAGIVDVVADEATIFAQIRELVAMLPSNNEDDDSLIECTDDINRVCAELENCAGDTSIALSQLADNGVFFETKADYAKEMVTGFIKLNGVTVGAVANRTVAYDEEGNKVEELEAVLTAKGCDKAAEFVQFCDAFSIPLLTLTNVNGFCNCQCAEKKLAKALATYTYALSSATCPKVNLITGQAYGSAYAIMNSKSLGADLVYAWADAKVGMMESSMAAKIMYPNGNAEEINEKAAEYATLQSSVTSAARRGYVDTIIEAEDTRKYVIGAFEMLFTKREDRPSKKHGTV